MAKNLYDIPNHPLVLVISGPSGVGKDTIAQHLLNSYPEQFHFVVTATTRPPRRGEVNGEDYIFVSTDEFAGMIEAGELLEYAVVYNDYKGIPKQQIRDALASGKDVIIRVDVQGAATVSKLIPNAVSVFLIAETEEALVQRLKERKSETTEGLALRTAMARREINRMPAFKYVVVNQHDCQDKTVAQLMAIVLAEHCRVGQTAVNL